MCVRIFESIGCDCGHREFRFEACPLLQRRQEQLRQEAHRNNTWLNRFLNREPPAVKELRTSDCKAPTEIMRSSRCCPGCVRKQREREEIELREIRQEVEQRERERWKEKREKERRMHESILRLRDVAKDGNGKGLGDALEEAKEAYLCIRCLREDRLPGGRERAVNSGFCCANGVDEWEFEFGALERRRKRVELMLDSSRLGDRSVPSVNLATYTPSGQMLFSGYGKSVQSAGRVGVDDQQRAVTIQTGHGTIPLSPSGELPRIPSGSTKGLPQTNSSPRMPVRPTQLPNLSKRPLPDVPNFRPGVSSDSGKNLKLNGLSTLQPKTASSPSSSKPLNPKLIKVPSTGRRDTTIAVKPIVRHQTAPLSKDGLDRKGAFIVKAKTSEAEKPSNGASSPGLRKPFSYEGLTETFSMSSQVPWAYSSRSIEQPSPSPSRGAADGTLSSRPQAKQTPTKIPRKIPTSSAPDPRQLQASCPITQKSLPPLTPKQPTLSSTTMARHPPSNHRPAKPPAPNVDKPPPPLPSPRYPARSPLQPSLPSARTPNPRNLLSFTPPKPPHQGGLSVRGTPPSSTTPTRPLPGNLSVRTTPSSLTPESRDRGGFSTQNTPSSSVRTTPPSSTRPIPSKDISPPKPRYLGAQPPNSPLSSPSRPRNPPPLPSSPVSTTNERWEDPHYKDSLWEDVAMTSAHRQSSPNQRPGLRSRSSSPVSPLSTTRPKAVGEQWGETRDQSRPQVEASGIESRRRGRGVMTTVDDEIDGMLDLWTGPAAMTRVELEEKEKEEKEGRGGEVR